MNTKRSGIKLREQFLAAISSAKAELFATYKKDKSQNKVEKLKPTVKFSGVVKKLGPKFEIACCKRVWQFNFLYRITLF